MSQVASQQPTLGEAVANRADDISGTIERHGISWPALIICALGISFIIPIPFLKIQTNLKIFSIVFIILWTILWTLTLTLLWKDSKSQTYLVGIIALTYLILFFVLVPCLQF